jgi:hypothetical protein
MLILVYNSHHRIRVGFDQMWGAPFVRLNDSKYFLDFGSDSGDSRRVPPVCVWRLDEDPEVTALPHIAPILWEAWHNAAPFIDLVPN